jgi:tRNA-dihydrouridine synthase
MFKTVETTFSLAPMNDVTDTVFRQIISSCSPPDLFFTEFVSVDALASSVGRKAMENKLLFSENDKNLIVQVWGLNPKNYETQAKYLAGLGYIGIDINMGCPVDKIIKKGACSALMNNRELASDIIKATQNGADDLPVSVKTRIGFDEIDLTWIEFILEHNLYSLIVHGRTVKEMSNVNNHWEVMDEIVAMRNEISPNTKIVANGDVKSRRNGIELVEKYNLDGIMIGRAIFENPYVFSHDDVWSNTSAEEKLQLYLNHIDLFDKTWKDTKNPDVLKKFAKIYLTDFKGAHRLREMVMGERTIEGVRKIISNLL